MKPTTLSVLAATAAAVVVGSSTLSATAGASGGSRSPDRPERAGARSTIDPTSFAHPRQNPFYPLRPGTVTRLRGSDGKARYRERVEVTHRTKRIQGVTTTVVRDVLRRAGGSLAERTTDWYAADDAGNVWYFGEATATYDRHGHLDSREGSWQAGVGGARAGIIMPADPRPTDAYRQEYLRGHAEDQAWIVQRNASTKVPYGRLHHLVRSFEWSRLEPGVLSLKLYAPGIGIVREKDMSGGHESFVLVSVRRR